MPLEAMGTQALPSDEDDGNEHAKANKDRTVSGGIGRYRAESGGIGRYRAVSGGIGRYRAASGGIGRRVLSTSFLWFV